MNKKSKTDISGAIQVEECECCVTPSEKRLIDEYQLEVLVRDAMNIGCQQSALSARVWAGLAVVTPERNEQ